MTRKFLNATMVAIVVILAIGIYFASRPKPKAPKATLTSLNSAKIDSVTVTQAKHKPLVLKRAEGQWRLVQPIQAQANNAKVMEVLSIATSVCEQQIKPAEVTLSNLGLDPPKYAVKFDQTKVDIGMVEPLKFRRYAKVGKRICLIADPSAPGLGDQNYAGLVSTALVPEGKKLTKIEIPGYTVSRKSAKAAWTLAPQDASLRKDAAEKLAQAWQAARSTWNTQASTNQKDNGKPTKGSITLHFEGGGQERFIIAARKPRLELVRSDLGIEYHLSAATATDLLVPRKAPPPKSASTTKAPATPTATPAH